MNHTKEQLIYMGLIDDEGQLTPIKWTEKQDRHEGENPLFEYRIVRNYRGNYCVWPGHDWCLGCYKTLEIAKGAAEAHYKKEARLLINPTITDHLNLAFRWIFEP